MKTRVIRIAALILAVILMAALLSGCSNSKVKNLIDRFETACVGMDAETLLDCMDPAVSKPIRSILELLGADDINGILADIFKVLDFINFEGQDPSAVLSSVSIKPEAYVFNDAKDQCKVTATISYQVKGTEKIHTIVFDCILEGEEWYIKDTDF